MSTVPELDPPAVAELTSRLRENVARAVKAPEAVVRDVLVFVPRAVRLPDELQLRLRGRFRRRVEALWNGCPYVV